MEHKLSAEDKSTDLLELFHLFWRQKFLILLFTLVGAFSGLVYLFLSKPTYEVHAQISPPDSIEIDTLNYARLAPGSLLKPFDVKTIYDTFSRLLLAESTKYKFIRLYHQPPDKSNDASPQLNIKEIPRTAPTQYLITVRGENAAQLPLWLKGYVNFAHAQAKKQIARVMAQQQRNVLRSLKQEINIAREQAKEDKAFQLARLNEALKIAEAANLTEQLPVTNGIVVQDYLNEPSLMYSRGTKALGAEIKNLMQRNSDELFNPKLFQLQNRYNLYQTINVNLDKFQMFYLDGVMTSPKLPIAPRKTLVLAIFTFFALISSLLFVMLGSFLRREILIRF